VEDCIFCRIAARQEKAWTVYETDASFAFLDIRPMNPYHALVIPKEHFADIFDVPIGALQEMMGTLKYVVDLYHAKLGMTNVQIISSNGRAGQQDVFHLHFHIAPRHDGDGQDVIWKTTPELREQYDSMLERLGVGRLVGITK
jgi:histidine triad (HIT) family protein